MIFIKNKKYCGGLLSLTDKNDKIKDYSDKPVISALCAAATSSSEDPFITDIYTTLKDYTGPILNQGSYNSCGGYAGIYLANILMCKAINKSYDFKLNPLFTYYWGKYYSNINVASDAGSTIKGILTGIQEKGVWSCTMRYPSSKPPSDFDSNVSFKIQGFEKISIFTDDLISDLKYTLKIEQLPLLAIIDMCPDNINDKTGEITVKTFDGSIGAHILCLCGYKEYSDGNTYFLAANSWGRNWGDKGYAWIHGDVIKNFSLTPEIWAPIKTYY